MAYVYPAVFEPNDDGTYTVWFPDLPSCITEGKSLANAMEMARSALCTWIDSLLSQSEAIPEARSVKEVSLEGDAFATLIDADMDAYRRRMNQSAVRRTISLPKYLDDLVAEAHVSLSSVTQEALRERFGIAD